MEQIFTITDPKEIPSIVDVVHDCKFDKDKIIFDPKSLTLDIEFFREALDRKRIIGKIWFLKKLCVPIVGWVLRISYVESYQVQEGNQIGPGTEDFFNTITYNSHQKKIWINTVIAKGIEVKVKNLGISIKETGRLVGEKICLSIFDP